MRIVEKIYRFIGLAYRAGKVSHGSMAVQKSIINCRARLVLISEDSATRTKETLVKQCIKSGIPWIIMGSKIELGNSVGKMMRAAITINDKNFASTLTVKIKVLEDAEKSMGVVEWPKKECMN